MSEYKTYLEYMIDDVLSQIVGVGALRLFSDKKVHLSNDDNISKDILLFRKNIYTVLTRRGRGGERAREKGRRGRRKRLILYNVEIEKINLYVAQRFLVSFE